MFVYTQVQGVPGFSYALVRRAVLARCRGQARSLSLDLEDQVTRGKGAIGSMWAPTNGKCLHRILT